MHNLHMYTSYIYLHNVHMCGPRECIRVIGHTYYRSRTQSVTLALHAGIFVGVKGVPCIIGTLTRSFHALGI